MRSVPKTPRPGTAQRHPAKGRRTTAPAKRRFRDTLARGGTIFKTVTNTKRAEFRGRHWQTVEQTTGRCRSRAFSGVADHDRTSTRPAGYGLALLVSAGRRRRRGPVVAGVQGANRGSRTALQPQFAGEVFVATRSARKSANGRSPRRRWPVRAPSCRRRAA